MKQDAIDPDYLDKMFQQAWIGNNLRYGAIEQDNAAFDVVIVPALNRPYHYYYRLAQWLADTHRANIYIPDRYGADNTPETGIIRQQCDQLHEFFDRSGVNGERRPLYVIGHSWGGFLALNYLAESHDYEAGLPNISGALLGAPFLRMNASIRIPFGRILKKLGHSCIGQLNLSLRHNSLAHSYMRVARPGLFNDGKMVTHDPVLQDFEQRHPEFSNKSLNIAQIGQALRQQEWLRQPDMLGGVATPVGILSAELEGFICNNENARIANTMPNGWHATLKGAKHGFMHPDDDTVFAQLQHLLNTRLLRTGAPTAQCESYKPATYT